MTRRAGPHINSAAFTRTLTRMLPTAVITQGSGNTVLVEGMAGAYTATLTAEAHDEWETASVTIALTQPPGFDEPLPHGDAIGVPHGDYSLTSDFGRRLVVDHGALAREAAQIIKTFEVQSPVLSAQATT